MCCKGTSLHGEKPESKGCHHLGNSQAPVLKESKGSAKYYKIITNALDCHRFPFITTICNLSTESLFGTSYKMSILQSFLKEGTQKFLAVNFSSPHTQKTQVITLSVLWQLLRDWNREDVHQNSRTTAPAVVGGKLCCACQESQRRRAASWTLPYIEADKPSTL